ncbi:putative ORFan [Tupanvirus deep ocean]|uniref:ORFan n=2 Tax=Tupanvirus TaxID=2094720 RepID=A0AC62A7J2_9VIRU|nr:putative ORFan [Tupanvirus deep ocean]QKU33645.1 putative ORFan [Tupanvirus deep ocean]
MSNEILNHIKTQLVEIINDLADDNEANRNFLIQYTVFEDHGDNEWYMNCILSECCDEGVYDVNVEYSQESNIVFDSHKGNYDDFCHTLFEDERGNSSEDKIYACDLFDNFEPRHYKGTCCTRGGFTGWNWFTLKDSA